jgi:hypothetical protein
MNDEFLTQSLNLSNSFEAIEFKILDITGKQDVAFIQFFVKITFTKRRLLSGVYSGRIKRLPTIMRPKLQKQSALKLAGRIIPRSGG